MAERKGKCYSIGVGPGDPGLLTSKAIRIIEACPVLASPKTKQAKTLAMDIVQHAVNTDDKTVLALRFPMTYSQEERQKAHCEAANEIAKFLEQGEDVAMLTLGDPSIYATASYVQAVLEEKGYETEVVPGVPSFCAAAAGWKVPLVLDREPLTIIPVAAGMDELSRALDAPGTKVVMKAGSKLPAVLQVLEEKDLLSQTYYAENVGLPEERFLPVSSLPDSPGYFVTLIVTDRK